MDLAYFTQASEEDLRQARRNINHELEQRARRTLELAAEQYTSALGAKEGVEMMAEDLCRHIAARAYPGGWTGIVTHMMKISG